MRVKLTSGDTLVELDLNRISRVVVCTEDGTPCSLSVETPSGVVITGHAAEKDFKALLSDNAYPGGTDG